MRRTAWLGLAVAASACLALTSVPAGATSPPGAQRETPTTVVATRAPIGPVTIGRVAASGTSMCIDGYVWFQAYMDPINPAYRVPFGGVVTSISHFSNASTGRIQAVFLTPAGADYVYNITRRSALLTLGANRLNTFPVQIPVNAGEFLALRTVDLNVRCIAPGGTIDQITAGAVTDTQTTFGPPVISNLHQFVNIPAVVEPDVDSDGYGDATQDACPQLAAVHDPCPAPTVTVTKAPKPKTSKHKAKVAFAANVAGSSFACSVDGRAFAPCGSPYKGRFPLGTHTVRVMATSPVGVAGQPVTVQFKVVKPKR